MAVLMGGGIKHIDKGREGAGLLWATIVEENLQRCERAGFDRRERLTIPTTMPWVSSS
jgi:hypothetical protein